MGRVDESGALMKLNADGALCAGHRRCYTLAPDLLSPDDEGFVTPRDTAIPVSSSLEEQARAAVSGCPESALVVLPD